MRRGCETRREAGEEGRWEEEATQRWLEPGVALAPSAEPDPNPNPNPNPSPNPNPNPNPNP